MPVQYVIRPRTAELHDYRGYAGQVAAGTVTPGDEVVVLPGGARTTVAAVETADGPLDRRPAPGRSVTVLLADDIDISRGDLLAAAAAPPRGHRRAGRHPVLAGREAAAPRRPAAAQARHPRPPR